MAKPIRATPKLNQSETTSFLSNMIRIEQSKITASDKKLAKEIFTDFFC